MSTKFFRLAGIVLGTMAIYGVYLFISSQYNSGGPEYSTDIAVLLMLKNDGFGIDYDNNPIPQSHIHVMIWHDGSILLECHDDSDNVREMYKFQRGLIEKDNLEKLLDRLLACFRIKNKRTYMWDYGPSASFRVLAINTDKHSVTIETWEQSSNVAVYPKKLLLHRVNTANNAGMYLGEFYEKWEEAKDEIFTFMKNTNTSELTPVDVVAGREFIHIYDKEGTLLLRQKLFQM